MKIEAVDFFYLSMPEVLDIGDGSQDALLVRISAGGYEGWGECEASPLTCIASYVTPMSHSASKPLKYSLEGKSINSIQDIYDISDAVHRHSFDLLQSDHTLSGIDIALWDLLGKKLNTPVYALLGFEKVYPKLAYSSQLFGDTPQETYEKAVLIKAAGFKAMKFGWGPFGRKDLKSDVDQLVAARQGAGNVACLMIDAGTVWNENFKEASRRTDVLKTIKAYWLEEPFTNLAFECYQQLSQSGVHLAGGEGCNNFIQARSMINYSGIKFIQIDAGRIGGITVAKRVADLASQKNVRYVNHTFTSNLALSASLQPYAGNEQDIFCEYPVDLKPLAKDITTTKITPDKEGRIQIPERPGLGITIDTTALKKYLIDVEIKVTGKQVYRTPCL
jgi:L-alanine-DL-glutamate epimerase-like enolase superfamily enzyme